MNNTALVEQTIAFVKRTLKHAEGGHDWFHIQRVYLNAQHIARFELEADFLVVALGALLHDIADAKFHDGDETIGPKVAADFLTQLGIDTHIITHVCNIIKYSSFKASLDAEKLPFSSLELQIVQDADRLDAIGAIGIARTFNYGGFKNRPLYDPDIAPVPNQSKEAYKKSTAPTINHFYEKLLLLKDMMHTETARTLAKDRHAFMLHYLEQFYGEWNGKI